MHFPYSCHNEHYAWYVAMCVGIEAKKHLATIQDWCKGTNQRYTSPLLEKVLRSLPKKFDIVTIGIEESRDLTQLTLFDLFGSLQVHEDKLKNNEELLDQAFQRKLKVVDDKKKQSSTVRNDFSSKI